LPDLIGIQKDSFAQLVDTETGLLRETIDDVSPIEDYTGNLAVVFGELNFDEPTASISECREKDLTYSRPLTVRVAFQNRETGEIREQSVFMGDFPWMTDTAPSSSTAPSAWSSRSSCVRPAPTSWSRRTRRSRSSWRT
jgi:DNA-directed RNA polymerase subunit beta